MSKSRRTELISSISRAAVLKYCPQYFKGGVPFIVRDTIDYGPLKGQDSYLAIYPYNGEIERTFFTIVDLESGREEIREYFSARIEIVSKTGVVYEVIDANNRVYSNIEIWKGFNFIDK